MHVPVISNDHFRLAFQPIDALANIESLNIPEVILANRANPRFVQPPSTNEDNEDQHTGDNQAKLI
jgi:hypothetical protein